MLCMIVACDIANAIGVDNKLPWHLPNDLAHFKRLTMGCPIIMGRKTFHTIGHPLPGRDNWIVSRNCSSWEELAQAGLDDKVVANGASSSSESSLQQHSILSTDGGRVASQINKPVQPRKFQRDLKNNAEIKPPELWLNAAQSGKLHLGADLAETINDARRTSPDGQNIFIIGGGEIYNQTVCEVERVYLTRVQTKLARADAWFPGLEDGVWQLTSCDPYPADATHKYAYDFQVWERN